MSHVREILLGHCGGVDTTPVGGRVLRMYWRVVSLFEGARVLLEERLPEEAIILGRQMFTDSLYLMEIARREGDHASLVLGLANEALTEWERLEDQARRLGVGGEGDQRLREHVAKERKKIEKYRLRHGIGRLESFGDEKKLARTHDRLGEYVDFLVAHKMVHVTEIAQSGRTRRRDSQTYEIHLRNADEGSLIAASAFAMRSALHAHRAVASIFAWTETPPEEIDGLLADVEQL